MPPQVPFRDVLRVLESAGWRLVRIWPPYRVFSKAGRLPILVKVEDLAVNADDFEKIKAILARETETE
jgi:hypothetical protein